MKNQTEIQYLGMTGRGVNKTEAKANACAKIEKAIGANYAPVMLAWRGWVAVAWQTPWGIVSGVTDTGELRGGTCHHPDGSDMAEIKRGMRQNLAQLGADIDSNEVPAILAYDSALIASYASWLGFQRAYRNHMAQCQDANKSHTFACDNHRQFEPRLTA